MLDRKVQEPQWRGYRHSGAATVARSGAATVLMRYAIRIEGKGTKDQFPYQPSTAD